MMKKTILILFPALVCLLFHPGNFDTVAGDQDRILAVAQHMEATFKGVEDYSCEVEQIFYQNGEENQRYRFKFYFKKEKRIRVNFSNPHPGLTVIYNDDETEATVLPFRSLPALKFRLSVNNPLLKTLAGQRINQTDMGYFIDFLAKNLKKVDQKENTFYEDEQRVEFLFWAMDYVEGKSLEKYRISISKKYWLPIRIERYGSEGKLLEVSDIKNYVLNAHLEDKFFLP
jgi:outer membrane lipoprotein-sorting protein